MKDVKITSIFQLLSSMQKWSKFGPNFAVSVESVCEFFGMNTTDQLLKITDDEYMLNGVYTTSPEHGNLPRLAIEQFINWILNTKLVEVAASKKEEFKVFARELMLAMADGRVYPFNRKHNTQL